MEIFVKPVGILRKTRHIGGVARMWSNLATHLSAIASAKAVHPITPLLPAGNPQSAIRNLPRQSEATAGPQLQLIPPNST
jgi:hypothetical protein